MIPLPDGWRRVTAVGSEIYASPDRSVQIRYRMRVTPLRRVAAIVHDALAELPEWHTARVGERERIATHEGEYAFGVAVDGRWLDTEARRYVAVIYGDDFANILDVVALGTAPLDTRARALVHRVSLGLGARPRRYFYDRPTGWHGHATGLVTHWFPAMFPARPSTIVVYPATPTNEPPEAVFAAMAAHYEATGAVVHELAEAVPFAGRDGLQGLHGSTTLAWHGRTLVRDLVVYARGAITYTLQLDSVRRADDEARAQFLELARSVEALSPGGVLDPGTVFSHYA